jgi:hypothetical protein
MRLSKALNASFFFLELLSMDLKSLKALLVDVSMSALGLDSHAVEPDGGAVNGGCGGGGCGGGCAGRAERQAGSAGEQERPAGAQPGSRTSPEAD